MPDPYFDYTTEDWSQYLPQEGGYFDTGGNAGGLALATAPFMGLGGLFGNSGDTHWKPYMDPATGRYVFQDPKKKVPVPITEVPGTAYRPPKQYKDTAESVRTLIDLLPYYSRAIAGQQIPDAQAGLAAAQSVSPGYQQLQLDLLKHFGVPLADEGNKIALRNALASAERDKSVLEGPGKDLIARALEQYKLVDPEFFSTRELTADKLGELLSSIDLKGGLSGSERSEIERSLAQEGARRGTINAPSQLDTVGNAMRYGEAGRKRELENRSELSKAIMAATAFMPSSRTGVDPFQVATGKSSTPNFGTNQFLGNTNPANQAQGNAGGIFGAANQFGLQNNQITATEKLNQKDWADYLNQVTSSIGDIAGGVAKFI